ncbi:hypothetical protein V8C43DRAFT_231852 [Trichoderma afarasin]
MQTRRIGYKRDTSGHGGVRGRPPYVALVPWSVPRQSPAASHRVEKHSAVLCRTKPGNRVANSSLSGVRADALERGLPFKDSRQAVNRRSTALGIAFTAPPPSVSVAVHETPGGVLGSCRTRIGHGSAALGTVWPKASSGTTTEPMRRKAEGPIVGQIPWARHSRSRRKCDSPCSSSVISLGLSGLPTSQRVPALLNLKVTCLVLGRTSRQLQLSQNPRAAL